MPDDKKDSDQEVTELLKRTMGTFVDFMVQVVALQCALADAGLLNLEKVQEHAVRLEKLEAVRDARSTYGARSAVLEALLQSFEGPLQ